MDIALHPRFAENHLIYFTYSKPKAGETEVAIAPPGESSFTRLRRDRRPTRRSYEENFDE